MEVRVIILLVMSLLFLICNLKSAFKIDTEKTEGVYYISAMTFLFGISIMLNFSLISQQDDFNKEIKELKKGLPKYEEIHGVYIIKNK